MTLGLGAGVAATITLMFATGAPPSLQPAVRIRQTAAGRACGSTQFRARMRTLHRGPMGEVQALVLTNAGRTTCRLSGPPRLALIGTDGRTVLRPPVVVADHRSPAVVRPGHSASIWLDLLAPDGLRAPRARQLLVRLNGIRGPLSLRVPRADLTEQQLVVSSVAAGSVGRLPRSTGTPLPCRHLRVVTAHRLLGAGAGSSTLAVELRNVGRRSCSTGGFPKLSVTTRSGRELYRIPERRRGSHARIELAPREVASAWLIYPDCGAIAGARIGPYAQLRERVSVGGTSALSGSQPELVAWPTPRCTVAVSALAAGVYRMGPGLTGTVR